MNDELTAELMKNPEHLAEEESVATPATEQETTPEAEPEPAKATETPAEEEGQTIEEVLKELADTPPADEEEEVDDTETVPLATHLETKKKIKDLKAQIKELKDNPSGSSDEERSDSIDALADEYPEIDPSFMKKLAKVLKNDLKKENDAVLKPIKEGERQKKVDEAFDREWKKVINLYPEFEKVANREVIKSLSMDPKNAKKTFAQITEEVYGNSIVGRKTMESPTPRGGGEPETVDMDRASTDATYLDKILANPVTKKEYNEKAQGLYRL